MARAENDYFGPVGFRKVLQARDDGLNGARALHLRRKQANVQAGEAALQDVQHVANHGAGGRGNNADAHGVHRQRTLADGGEQALGFELLLQLLEGELQRAEALRLDGFDDQLIFAARFVDVDLAARQHRDTLLRLELHQPQRATEAGAFDLRGGVFQVEVGVAAGGHFEAGNFARHPNVAKLAAE
jgi:hypothetical protein